MTNFVYINIHSDIVHLSSSVFIGGVNLKKSLSQTGQIFKFCLHYALLRIENFFL